MPADRSRWRGLSALVHDAVDATTDLVGTGHASAHRRIQQVADRVGLGASEPVREAVHLGTRGTLATVKAVNHLVGALTDAALEHAQPVVPDTALVPMRSDAVGTGVWMADAALGALNGTVGDHLARTSNALDLGLRLRLGDRILDGDVLTAPTLVLVHGLGTTEWCWSLDADVAFGDPAATLGTLLGAELGLDPVYVRYNTGRAITESGIALAEALERHLADSPRLVLLGHSMGGLVARAAASHAEAVGHRWLAHTDWVIALGTPHQGAPLARFGAHVTAGLDGFDSPTTKVLAGILSGRSTGVRDLEHGDIRPLVAGPRYAFFGTTFTQDPAHPAGRWIGDLLVQVQSSSGLPVELGQPVHSALLGGIPHHRIQADSRVLEALRQLLREPE